jgi:hypothetical protein
MKTTLSSDGALTLPIEWSAEDGVTPTQEFEIQRLRAGEYLVQACQNVEQLNHDLLAWLESCPVKGWFQAIPSESTDPLPEL